MSRALVAVLVLAAALCVRAAAPKCYVSPVAGISVGKNHGCLIDSAGGAVTVPKGVQGCTNADGCVAVPATGGQIMCWGQTTKGQYSVPGAKYKGYLNIAAGGDITCERAWARACEGWHAHARMPARALCCLPTPPRLPSQPTLQARSTSTAGWSALATAPWVCCPRPPSLLTPTPRGPSCLWARTATFARLPMTLPCFGELSSEGRGSAAPTVHVGLRLSCVA